MSKPIRSFSETARPAVVARRLLNKEHGLGYWSAVDYQTAKAKKAAKEATK